MIGGSYEGLTQWWAAAAKPPHLHCIVPQAIGCVRESNVPSFGTGVPGQYWLWWMTMVTGRTMQNGAAPSWESQMSSLPLRNIDERLGVEASAWQDYVAGKIDYLSADFALTAEEVASIDIPVMIHVGWWDDQTTMATWSALQASKSARDCRLVIGAWDHAGNAAPRAMLGGVDMSASVMDIADYTERFLALHLKGEVSDRTRTPRCRIFQTGAQQWDDLEEWPRPDSVEVSWYLASDGDARSLRGNGCLRREPPQIGAAFDSYIYNPNQPPRDFTNMSQFAWSDPPLDQRYFLRRTDVLVYDTDMLFEPLTISGRARFVLFVSTDQIDTDLFASIYDVHPDGRAIVLGGTLLWEGALRLSHRGAELLVPRQVIEVKIAGHWMHHIVRSGHRLRVAIASGRFPHCARNGGTGEFWADEKVLFAQTNTIHHSKCHPSRLLLPVVAATA